MSAPDIQEAEDFDAALNSATKEGMDAFFAAMMEEEDDGGTDSGGLDRGNAVGVPAK